MGWLGFIIALLFALMVLGVRPGRDLIFLIFVIGAAWLFFSVFTRAVRGMFLSDDEGAPKITGGRICTNTHCRRVNESQAQYCAQCGQRLPAGGAA